MLVRTPNATIQHFHGLNQHEGTVLAVDSGLYAATMYVHSLNKALTICRSSSKPMHSYVLLLIILWKTDKPRYLTLAFFVGGITVLCENHQKSVVYPSHSDWLASSWL